MWTRLAAPITDKLESKKKKQRKNEHKGLKPLSSSRGDTCEQRGGVLQAPAPTPHTGREREREREEGCRGRGGRRHTGEEALNGPPRHAKRGGERDGAKE